MYVGTYSGYVAKKCEMLTFTYLNEWFNSVLPILFFCVKTGVHFETMYCTQIMTIQNGSIGLRR